MFFGEGNAELQVVFFGIGDARIHERFVFVFVIGVAIEVAHAGELADLVSDEFLFVESIAEAFIYFVVIPEHLLIHVVGREEFLFIRKGRIGFDEVLGFFFWMKLIERTIWNERHSTACFFAGSAAWIGFFAVGEGIEVVLHVISHGLGNVFLVWMFSCISFINAYIKRGGIVQFFLWRHEDFIPIVSSPCFMRSRFSLGIAFLGSAKGDFLYLVLFGDVIQSATGGSQSTPSSDAAVFIGHIAGEGHVFAAGNGAGFGLLHLFFRGVGGGTDDGVVFYRFAFDGLKIDFIPPILSHWFDIDIIFQPTIFRIFLLCSIIL